MVRLGEVNPPIYDEVVTKKEESVFEDDSAEEPFDEFNWRKAANKRKFNRELFEKYGYLKDVILHPKFQHVKHYLEENADLNIFIGDPLLPTTTAIIILFLLNKRVSNNFLGLAALLIFNVNPLYVCMAVVVFCLLTSSKKVPKGYKKMHKGKQNNVALSIRKDGIGAIPLTVDASATEATYDHVLVGSDLSTLYTAALLAKNGHRCCVLQPAALGSTYEIKPEGAPCPAPILDASVARIEKYQALLDAALPSLQPTQRVVLAPIGTAADGYTSAIIRTHTDTAPTAAGVKQLRSGRTTSAAGTKLTSFMSYLRVGEGSLVLDLCSALPVDRTQLLLGLQRIFSALPFLTGFLVSRCVPAVVWGRAPEHNSEGQKRFRQISTTSVEGEVRSMNLDSSPKAVAALQGAAVVGAQEPLCAADCSAYCLASAIFDAAQGQFYPPGGAVAVAQALCSTVEQAGGTVYSDVAVQQLVLEEVPGTKSIRATGVTVCAASSTTERSSSSEGSPNTPLSITFQGSKSVVSGLGAIATFTKLVPPEAVTRSTQEALCALREQRPVAQVVYWLRGEDHGLSATSFYSVGAQPALSQGSDSTANGATAAEGGSENQGRASDVKAREEENEKLRAAFAADYVRVWSPSRKDPYWASRNGADVQVVIVELALSNPIVETRRFVIDHTDTATTAADDKASAASGPLLYYSPHPADTASDPGHVDFDSALAVPVTLSKSKQDRLRQRADQVLDSLYPEVLSSVEYVHVHLPVLTGGAVVANTIEKYAAKLSAVTDIQNLYLTGRDLATAGLAGDLQGGWVAANAVLGYTLGELVASRNIVSDLANL